MAIALLLYLRYRHNRMGNLLTRTVDGAQRTYTYGRPPDPGEPAA